MSHDQHASAPHETLLKQPGHERPVRPLERPLDEIEVRVLGALIEKEIATPEQYPLSVNALLNACNQRSSRDPVVDFDEQQVRTALDNLDALALTGSLHDARVAKYEHRARTVLNLRRDETAILCLLLLRGAQSPGELRARTDRLFPFDDLAAVQSTLERLATRTCPADVPFDARRHTPLVAPMPRQPGAREPRYRHLLGRPRAPSAPGVSSDASQREHTATPMEDRLAAEIASLREQLAEHAQRLARLEASTSR